MKLKKMICILSVMICLFGLTGCCSSESSAVEEKKDAQVERVLGSHKMVTVNNNGTYKVIVDKKTKVVYLSRSCSQYESGLTPLYNADGSLVLLKNSQLESTLGNHNMVVINNNGTYKAIVDSETKVIYLSYSSSKYESGFTPLYNADGSLVLFDGDLSLYE